MCVCGAYIVARRRKNGRPELNGGGDPANSGVPAHESEGREGVAKMKKRDVCVSLSLSFSRSVALISRFKSDHGGAATAVVGIHAESHHAR